SCRAVFVSDFASLYPTYESMLAAQRRSARVLRKPTLSHDGLRHEWVTSASGLAGGELYHEIWRRKVAFDLVGFRFALSTRSELEADFVGVLRVFPCRSSKGYGDR